MKAIADGVVQCSRCCSVAMTRDIVFAWRTIVRMPALAVVVILSLGVGIGVNTVVFSWMQSVLFRPIAGVRHAGDFHLVEPGTARLGTPRRDLARLLAGASRRGAGGCRQIHSPEWHRRHGDRRRAARLPGHDYAPQLRSVPSSDDRAGHLQRIARARGQERPRLFDDGTPGAWRHTHARPD